LALISSSSYGTQVASDEFLEESQRKPGGMQTTTTTTTTTTGATQKAFVGKRRGVAGRKGGGGRQEAEERACGTTPLRAKALKTSHTRKRHQSWRPEVEQGTHRRGHKNIIRKLFY